ncbi:hypothetical protein DFH28DRAFT_947115 [Melampsora americana]|nr:hypothetical protein DFH28DRAFT_947115 [Melampsora americana]
MKKRKPKPQDVLTKNSLACKRSRNKTPSLEAMHRADEESHSGFPMLNSMGIHSQELSIPTKTCAKSRSREYDGVLRRSRKYKSGCQTSMKYNKRIPNGKLKKAHIKSKETTPADLNYIPQKAEDHKDLDQELIRLISLVKRVQGQRNSHKVNPHTKYPPLFKKMVVESVGEFKSQRAAAKHHNIHHDNVNHWVNQYKESGGSMECWNYIEERDKFKREVVDWHKKHGCDIDLTCQTFHLQPKTLGRWLKTEETHDVIESYLTRETPTSVLKAPKYPDDLKRSVVEYYQKSGDTQSKVATDLGITPVMISRWQKKLMSEDLECHTAP